MANEINNQTLESQLLAAGGKLWEKGNLKRIYVKSSVVKQFINFEAHAKEDSFLEKNTKAIFSRIDSEGAWLNCHTKQFESKKATVQNWFEHSEFSNLFGY